MLPSILGAAPPSPSSVTLAASATAALGLLRRVVSRHGPQTDAQRWERIPDQPELGVMGPPGIIQLRLAERCGSFLRSDAARTSQNRSRRMQLEGVQREQDEHLQLLVVTQDLSGLPEQLPRIEARNGERELQRRIVPTAGVLPLAADTTTHRIESPLVLPKRQQGLPQARERRSDLEWLRKLGKDSLEQLDGRLVMARLGQMHALDPHVLRAIVAMRTPELLLELGLVDFRPRGSTKPIRHGDSIDELDDA